MSTAHYGSVSDPPQQEEGEEEEVMELNKVLDTIGVGLAQALFWSVGFLIAYSDYAELTLIAIIIPYLRCEWNLSEGFEATITISIFLTYAASELKVPCLQLLNIL